jgi:RHS repeat-associated protein
LYDSDTKLVHFGYREYDPFTGKWSAKDPLLFGGGDSNLYGYVLGDPVNLVDPDGQFAINPWTVAIAIGSGYLVYDLISDGYEWLKNRIHDINNPKSLGDPKYHKQISNACDETRELGKEFTHDVLSAEIPFSKPVETVGGLIYETSK